MKQNFLCQMFDVHCLFVFCTLCSASTWTMAMRYKAHQSLTRTAVTYRRQTVCILQYWSPDGCWPRSDTCHCLFCLAWLWLIPCPPRSYAQYLAALLHPWTTGPGLVWGIKNKEFLLLTCCIVTLGPNQALYIFQLKLPLTERLNKCDLTSGCP